MNIINFAKSKAEHDATRQRAEFIANKIGEDVNLHTYLPHHEDLVNQLAKIFSEVQVASKNKPEQND